MTDGTLGGTRRISNKYPLPGDMQRIGNDVYFGASDYPDPAQPDLFRFNVASNRLRRLTTTESSGGSYGGIVGVAGGSLLYSIDDDIHAIGGELKTDKDLYISITSGYFGAVKFVQGDTSFYVVNINVIYKISGPTSIQSWKYAKSVVFVDAIAYSKGNLYIATSAGQTGSSNFGCKLWKSDGTAQGTTFLKALPGKASDLTMVGIQAYFTVDDEQITNFPTVELWTSDGTGRGTHLLKSIGTLGSMGGALGLDGTTFVLVNQSGAGLASHVYRTNGTAAGTSEIPMPDGVTLESIVASSHHLYFSGHDNSHGWELWSVNTAGSKIGLLRDINREPIAPPTRISVDFATTNPDGTGWTITFSSATFRIDTDFDAVGSVLYLNGQEIERLPAGDQLEKAPDITGLIDGTYIITAASIAADGSLSAQTAPKTLTVDLEAG